MPSTVVVTVGDELLLGDTIDSNAARIGRALGELGAPVLRRETVGDQAAAIRAAVARGLADADLVISRSGAGALSELAVAGTPAILVPYPAAADRHQDANAAAAAQLGAAVIVWQHPPSEPALERSLWRLLGPRLRGAAANSDPLVAMGAAMAQLAVRDADRQVAALLLSLHAQRSASS